MNPSDIILHHTPRSAYAEKIRLMLDTVSADWKQVKAPVHTNKRVFQRRLVEGYSRRIPLLQIGADVFCDTDVITHELATVLQVEAYSKENLTEEGRQFVIDAESKYFAAFLGSLPPADIMKSYFKDYPLKDFYGFVMGRVQSFKGRKLETIPHDQAVKLRDLYLDDAENRLKKSPYLFSSEAPTLADFSFYHLLWYQFLNNNPTDFTKRPNLENWYKKLTSKRKGEPQAYTPEQVAGMVKKIQPRPVPESMKQSSRIGQTLTLQPSDDAGPATLPTTGVIVGEDDYKIILKREDPEMGTIHVHYPKCALGACL